MTIRILAISPTFYPVMGGAERTIFELFKRLPKYGYHIDLVTPNLGGKEHEKICEGFEVYRINKKRENRLAKFVIYQISEYFKIKELIKKNKYDLIHCSYALPNCFVAYWVMKKIEAPLIIGEYHLGTGMDITNEDQNPIFSSMLLKWIYNKSSTVLAMSSEQKRFVEKMSDKRNIPIINSGTDPDFFNPKNNSKQIREKYKIKGKMLLTVSRLNKRKNIEDLIKAMKIVVEKHPKTKLLIIGKGEEQENIEKQIKDIKLSDNVYLLGFVTEKDLSKYYATADIFVLTSKYEGQGTVNCESMASGTPVVSYDTTGSREVIINGETGFITSQNYIEFSKKIIKLIENEKLLKSMGKKAIEHVVKNFTWEKYAKDHDREFRKILY